MLYAFGVINKKTLILKAFVYLFFVFLVADAGVTLNGTLAFTAQHQTKTIYRVSSGIYDVVG